MAESMTPPCNFKVCHPLYLHCKRQSCLFVWHTVALISVYGRIVDLIASHSGSGNREAVARWAAATAAAADQPLPMTSKYENISAAHRLSLLTTSLKQDLHSDR